MKYALVWKPIRILLMGWRAAAGADTIASDGRRGLHISRGATRHLHIDGDGPPARNGRAVFTQATSNYLEGGSGVSSPALRPGLHAAIPMTVRRAPGGGGVPGDPDGHDPAG